MGNGKTTLVKEGICKAMKRPFAFVPLGGMQDSSYMIGHEYTYEGSKPGRIIEILTESGCMNPVIYFDELDKISKTEKGMEIENFLCHLTDTSQNTDFQDKYLSGINFDLSKATFIFSYNDPKKVNPILLDRFYKIKTKGFNEKNKTTIFKDYLLPRILKEFSFNKSDIEFTDEAIKQLINNYTENEKGVRNLKRTIETIVSKINVLRYMYPGEDEIKKDDSPGYKAKPEELISQAKSVIENAQNKEEKTGDNQENNQKQIKTDDNKEQAETDNPNIQLNIVEFSKNISEMEKDLEIKEDDNFTYKNDDILKISCNKFRLPFTISDKNLRRFITKNNDNTSIAHMYL
jgi:ATP-dependent Lon protease